MKAKLAALFLFFSGFLNAQWQWARSVNDFTSGSEVGNSVTTDINGNVYVAGNLIDGGFVFANDTIYNANSGTSDIFILKYNSNGGEVWARRAGGVKDDWGNSVATDAKGNVYVAGAFLSTSISFGNDSLFSKNRTFFLVKYDSLGNEIWAKQSKGSSNATSVKVDLLGNCYLTGSFHCDTVFFDSLMLVNTGNSNSTDELFIVKYDQSGNCVWAKSASGTYDDFGMNLNIDNNGNCYVTGFYQSQTLNFDTITLTGTGTSGKFFVMKLDSSGHVKWAQNSVGNNSAQGLAIAIDNQYVYVLGVFSGPNINFGSITLGNSGSLDIFLSKYDLFGNLLWSKGIGGTGDDISYGLAIGLNGSIYLTGFYNSPTLSIGNYVLQCNYPPDYDVFVMKFDSVGSALYATSVGGTWGAESYGIVADQSSDLYVTGSFSNDSISFGSCVIHKRGVFTAKLSSTTDIGQFDWSNYVRVFPNPTSGFFTIQSSENFSSIQIINLLGENIYSSKTNWNKSEIDLSFQPNGVYFLQLTTDKGIARKKIVISH